MKNLIILILLSSFISQSVFSQKDIVQRLYIEGVFFCAKIKVKYNNEKLYSKRITHSKNKPVFLVDIVELGNIEGEILVKIGMFKKIKVILKNNTPYTYLIKNSYFSTAYLEQKKEQKKYR